MIYYFFRVNLETALLIPSGAAILIYVIGSAAGVKMLGVTREEAGMSRIRKRMILPLISLGISLIVLPFVGWLLAVSLAVSIAALIYTRIQFSGEKLQKNTRVKLKLR